MYRLPQLKKKKKRNELPTKYTVNRLGWEVRQKGVHTVCFSLALYRKVCNCWHADCRNTIKKTNVICRGKKILGCLRLQMGGSQCHRREQGILGIAEILVGLLLTRIVYICQNPIKMCMVLYINYTSIKLMTKTQ